MAYLPVEGKFIFQQFQSMHLLIMILLLFLVAINRKKQAEAKKLLENKQKEFLITRDHIHEKEKVSISTLACVPVRLGMSSKSGP